MKNAQVHNGTQVNAAVHPEMWDLRLYVAGQTPKSVTAFANLKKISRNGLTMKMERLGLGLRRVTFDVDDLEPEWSA